MSQKPIANLSVTSSPHILGKRTTRGIMLDVVIAMLPAAFMAILFFGYRAGVVIAVCIAACVVLEALWCFLLKKPMAIGDLSCVVTGMLLAFNLPAGIPIWQALIGCFVAIILVKQLFGGIGCNFANPALTARIVMALSFPATMIAYSFPAAQTGVDAVASATPLTLIREGGEVPGLWTLFVGAHGGVLGETSALALLLGGTYLVIRRVINPIIPLSFIASTGLICWAFGCPLPLHAALSGGLFLGAIFMATDYVTSPYTNLGRLIFGLCCGFFTGLIRAFGNASEGVSYALLIMNLLVPYINNLVRRKPFGTKGVKHAN